MNTYAPSIIKSLGFTALQANGLNSVGSICALIWSVSLAFSSDRLQERGFHIAVGYLWGAIGLLWLALAPENVGKWVLYGSFIYKVKGDRDTDDRFRWRRLDSNGNGKCTGYQRSLAYFQNARL